MNAVMASSTCGLPATGSSLHPLILGAILLAIGVMVMAIARRTPNRLFVIAALPALLAVTPAHSTKADNNSGCVTTTTSAAPTTTAAGGSMTIVFAGRSYNTGFDTSWGAVSFCEVNTTNCVVFDYLSAPGTTKVLTLSSSPAHLRIEGNIRYGLGLWTSSPTAADAYTLNGATEHHWSLPYINSVSTWAAGSTAYWTDTNSAP